MSHQPTAVTPPTSTTAANPARLYDAVARLEQGLVAVQGPAVSASTNNYAQTDPSNSPSREVRDRYTAAVATRALFR